MTTDASVATIDAKAAYLRQPRTIRLALLAAFATAMLAGPVTMTLFVAGQTALGSLPLHFHDAADLAERIAELLAYSALFGLVGSVPAAAINTLLLAHLARRRLDGAGLAIGSGHTLGFLVGATIAIVLFLTDDWFVASTLSRLLDFALGFGLPMLVAGGFMGALHWSIVIRPRRRWRLFQERERAALLAME
jgi:hypothetical protein